MLSLIFLIFAICMYVKAYAGIYGIWRYIKPYGGIWRHTDVYDGTWRYMNVSRGICRFMRVYGGIWGAPIPSRTGSLTVIATEIVHTRHDMVQVGHKS